MSSPNSRSSTAACVWMNGGVLAYKLCDRDYDCEHCTLDAALRGALPLKLSRDERRTGCGTTVQFPDDRLYTNGHVWVQRVNHAASIDAARGGTAHSVPELVRIGLDAFAGGLLGVARRVVFEPVGRRVRRGERFCEVELVSGMLVLRAPLSGVLAATNPALADSIQPLVADPYTEGWLAELQVELREEFDALLPCDGARDRARHDLRRFGRLAAMDVLSNTVEVGATLPDGGEPLTDLHSILGDARYLSLLRDVIHN